MKAEVATSKTEATTGCAKHPNVKAEVAARKAEAATGCAKYPNVKAEVAARKTEAATLKAEVAIGKINRGNFLVYEGFYTLAFSGLLRV
ncbi:hypothetical protein [Nostoc favosum]|uniref:Uncharacterized protein n=1 Tax=Nostoc favosum CHAB5714 TaxID=2780399 RepID=A0ABS8I233_9NOSO|nr:hypothetical protein [Nostoc favosum]MCC5598254.1 hypothetical protein [Nostoc favosum CHAB5714]